jgi:hypothetical protein
MAQAMIEAVFFKKATSNAFRDVVPSPDPASGSSL